MKLAYCEGALLDNRETKNMQVKKIIAVCSNNNIMQAPEKMRVIPILKPDQESHQKWLDMTVQTLFREDRLTELYDDLVKAGEILPQIRDAAINSDGFLSQHAENGRYYCGQPVLSCECCDSVCGPTQGCNCDSCKATQKHQMEKDKDKRNCPPLLHPPKSWFWKEEITREHLEQYLFSLEVNQRNVIHEAMKSVKSFGRLNKRMIVLGRHLAAISYQCFGSSKKEETKNAKKGASNEEKAKEKAAEELPGFAQEVKYGIQIILSLMSKIMQRAWIRGEDADLCSGILIETLDTLQKLPEAFLYSEQESLPLWNEVLSTASSFLEKVVLGIEYHSIPIEDRRRALVLLYEFAFQYGTLHQMLEVVIVSLKLCICDEPSALTKMPLGNILQRLRNLMKDANQIVPCESEPKQREGASSSAKSQVQSGEEANFYDLKVVTMDILRFLSGLTTLYGAPSQDTKEKDTVEEDGFKHELLFWGGKSSPSLPQTPALCGTFVEIPIKQICITETQMVLLTRYQRVYLFVVNAESLTFSRLVQLPVRLKVTKIAASLDGRLFLALASTGEVYSWGDNDHGCLRAKQMEEGLAQSPIPGLAGKQVVHIACGTAYCAAVTDEGALYTWGSGEKGRLGHGSNLDLATPTLVEKLKGQNVVDVACGSGDAHTLAVTADGRIWSWGDGKWGKLGRGTEESSDVPELIDCFGSVIRASCGFDFSVCLTEDGKVWTWGRGECYQLGHGNRESLFQPKAIDSLSDHPVVDVACGYNHVVAVTQTRLVFFWGSHEPHATDAVAQKTPIVVGRRSGSLYFGIAAGPSQTFCWSAGKARKLVAKDRFSIDVCPETFDKLNDLFELCDPVGQHENEWLNSNRDKICIYALKMLKLQLLASKACGLTPFESSKTKGLSAESLKANIIRLCSASDISMSVRCEAQAVLRMGWSVLLPFAFERVVALNSMLADEDGATVAIRKRFVIDVLTDSLVDTGGLDSAIDIAVKEFSIKNTRKTDEGKTERAVDVIADFIELLLKIVTIDSLERLSENEIETTSQRGNFLFIEKNTCTILRYQRLLFARLFKGDENMQFWPSKGYFSDLGPSVKAISVLLKRYIQALVPCCKSLLKHAYEKVTKHSFSFTRMASFLLLTVPGVILREFLVLLTMAQNFAPAVASTSEGIPLLGELLDSLDTFNRASKDWQVDDADDLSWSTEAESKEVFESKHEKTARKISQEDLDESAKQGNTWVAIHNKVYDLTLMKEQAQCGAMLIEYYAGKDATSVFDSMHHSDQALAMMSNYYIGDFVLNQEQQATTAEPETTKHTSVATSFLDSQRTLALILGLHAGFLSCGVLVTSEELDKKKWMESQLFSGGVESSAVLRDISVFDQSEMPTDDNAFILEQLLYDCELNKPIGKFLENVKIIASQRDAIFSAIEFPEDHPIEKAVRAIFAATLMHLNLENEAVALSQLEIGAIGRQNEKSLVHEKVPKKLLDVIFSVYRQKLKIFRAHQEQEKSYQTICDAAIEKSRFVFYCLHSASGLQKRVQLFNEKQLATSRWQEAVQRISGSEGRFWESEKWWKKSKLSEEEQMVASETRSQFDKIVMEQLLDFVCDENMILDVLRKCFLYQIKRVKQRLISGYMMQSYILRHGMIASARYSLLYGWMGMDCQNAINYHPKPGIANNIELVSSEEFVKLKSVFDIIAHWAIDLLKKKVRELANATSFCKDASEAKDALLDHARPLTALIGMLTSQCHIDNIEYLVHSGIFASIQSILSCLEKARSDDSDIAHPCPMAVVVDEARHHVTSIRNLTGAEMAKLMKFGTRVVRGPDWKWGDQDGPAPSQGRIISDTIGEDGWVRVQWDTSSTNSYRMGKDGKYDLKLAEPHIPVETTDDDYDMEEDLYTQRDLKEQDLALALLHGACITILQHTAILVCLKSSTIQDRTVRIVSGLFMKIVKDAYLENNIAFCRQNQDWVTLGILRLFCSSTRFCLAFSQPGHITTLLNIVKRLVSNEAPSDGSRASSVCVQILILKLLGNLLPCVSGSKNEPFIDSVVHQLVAVLGDMLVRHVDFADYETGRHSSRHKRSQASVTASARGTIAEELIHLIRKLFSRPIWDKSISYVIEEALEKLARYLNRGTCAPAANVPGQALLLHDDTTVVAVLAIIGGADNRVRLGGTVENEDYGKGIVTRISRSGRICVQSCNDEQVIRNTPLSLWKVVEPVRLDVDKMQNLIMMKEVLPSILHFAILRRGKTDASKPDESPFNVKDSGAVDHNLKSQQIDLGLLVAARFLLPHSNILSCLLPEPSTKDGGLYNCWLIEELFNAALKPTAIKSIFHRTEMETAALTLIEYLLATKSPHREDKAASKKSEKHLKPPRRPRRRRNSSTRLPNPPLVVQQIVEMGFSRYAVEKALKEMGDEFIRPELIVTWLFDHPEVAQQPDNEEPHSDMEIDLSNDNNSDGGSDDTETSSDSDCQVTASEIKPAYKTSEDFRTGEEYEKYVLENVKVGAYVRFRDSKESRSEVGTVVKVFIDSRNKGSLEIQGTDAKIHQVAVSNDVELVKCQDRKIKVGDIVRVKESVVSPKYKWGAVNHTNIGSVTNISPDGMECQVDFLQQSGWTGLVSEMELVGAAHTGISCDGCHSNPICGPRFKCMTCFNFDLCGDCYNEMGNHRHTFYRYDEPGKSPQKHGKPPRTRSGERDSDGIVLTNLRKCVKDIWLVPDIEWHSTVMELRKMYRMKSKQKTRVCLEMTPGLRISKLLLSLDLSCPDCSLSSAVVNAGTSMISMRKLATVRIDAYSSSLTLLENIEEEYKFIDIEIDLCAACLVACKGNRLSIECTRKPPVCGIPATFMKFVAKDCQEELDRKLQRPLFKRSVHLSRKPLSERESKVFVWGLNDKEQLAGLKGSKVKTPVLSQALSSTNCHQIAGGSKTIFAVSSNGKAYACGESTNGRLGLGPITGNIAVPRQIEGLASVFVKKVAVHSGGRHAMALTTDGRVYSWGEGEDGQLGHNNRLSYDSPKLIEALDGLTVIEIAAGSSHSAAIVCEGDLYTWGLGEYGRLGHGDTETQLKPKMVKVLFSRRVTQISCGSRDAQTICLTDDGVVWSWGDGDFGKLGRGGSEGCLLPQRIERLTDVSICKVLCGAQFSLALTPQGIVYTWGKGDFYRLGHGHDSHVRRPSVVESLKGKKVVDVAVGALHCLAVTDEGEVYAWGDNDHGQQGNGTVAVNFRPAKVTGFEGCKITNVACGSSHSIAWAELNVAPQMLFSPIPLKHSRDPLGTVYVNNEFEEKKAEENVGQLMRRLRSSLSKYVLELRTDEEKKKSLDLILESLRVCYARDALIKVLGDITRNAVESAEADVGSMVAQGSQSNASPCALNAKEEKQETGNDGVVLSLANVKLLVSLLKLGLSNRLNDKQCEELTMILIHNAQKDKEIAMTLFQECASELEDVIANHELRKRELKPVVQDCPHPYQGIRKISGRIRIPGADNLRIEFDKNCSTEYSYDILSIMCGNGRTLAMRSGSDPSYWESALKVTGDEIRWKFTARSKGSLWGWKFTVFPETSDCNQDVSCISDDTALVVPSIGLAKLLLDHDIEQLAGPGSHCNRLTFALSACAQLPSLTADDRCWIFRKLTSILVSDVGPPVDVSSLIGCENYRDDVPNVFKYKSTGDTKTKEVISTSPLGTLIRGLPDAMRKQFESESKSGQHLIYSPFLRALVTLGRTLGLDYLTCCSDTYHWNWFTKFCMTHRVIESIIKRAPMPKDFLLDVRSRIQEISQGEEGVEIDYENHSLFTDEEDRQALSWLQRHPRDWFLSWRGSGNIYGWGHNHRGQLGGLDGPRIKSPQICDNLSSVHPVQICGGEQTLFCLSADGKIHATGYGSSGRLGVGGMATLTAPRVIESLQHVVVKKIAVHSGGKHCLALTSDGEIFSWGEGDDGKLGHGNRLLSERPRVIEKLLGTEIIDIACGGSHSAAISAAGELYTWGKGRYGRLGHGEGDTEDQLEPKLVEALRGFKVVDVACGSGDAQTLCVTDDDCVWSWGDGDFGKLGRGGSDGCKMPMRVDDLIGVGISKVECGSQFSLALSKAGLVYTWGKGDYYRLGHSSDDHVRRPKVVTALEGKRVVSVACGSLHCVVSTDRGEVYTWGDNDEGQLGDGTTNAVHKPTLLQSLVGKKIDHVACGSAHTIAWSTAQTVEPCRLPKEIPSELTKLQRFSIRTIRNRLLLLYQFSDLFWSALPLLDLDSNKNGSLFSERNIELLRSSLTSASKDSAFRKVINNTMVRDHQHGPIIDINRVSVKSYRRNGGFAGRNGSKSVFGQVSSKMSLFRSESLFLPHRIWKVKFIGESVDDCGGGYSESIAEMCEELQDGSLPLLIPTPDSRDEVEGVQKSFLLNPFARSQIHNDMFQFLGILIGIAIRTGSPLALNLAEPVWKQLSGASLSIEDIMEVDRGFLSRLNYVRELDLSNDEIELPFTVLSSNNTEIGLLEKYNSISNDNRNEYLKLVLQYRLHEFDQQVAAVREGMAKVVPVPLLVFFSGIELETMVCGSPHIPVDSLKAITSYKNIDASEPLVTWFWEVIEEFTSLERSLFLRFVWGRARLPRTAADFRGRDFVFQILDKFSPPNLYLPESYTCFFMLKMPRYTSKAILREKLKYAIHFCKSIDSDEYARVDLTAEHLNV